MTASRSSSRWETAQGRRVAQAVLHALRSNDWADEIYSYTRTDPGSPEIDLSGMSFKNADLRGVDFSCLILRDADFSNATLTQADFQQCDLDGANFQSANLAGANLVGCKARKASFRDSNLAGAFLISADLTSADFGGATLTSAAMSATLAINANFRSATLNSTDLDLANWGGAVLDDVTWSPASTQQAVLPKVRVRNETAPSSSSLSNLDLLRRIPLFAALTPSQYSSIAHAIVKKRFKRSEVLVEQGKKAHALYIILSGRARVMSIDARGREVILAVLHAGDHVGEMSLIDDEPHSATVRTEIQSDVLLLEREALARLLPESSSMSFNILRGLVTRLRHADRKIESLALMDVYGRVARSLLEFAIDDGEGNLRVRDKISRQDLAKMVGASREMVSRVMKDLEERGFVATQSDGSIVVKQQLSSLS